MQAFKNEAQLLKREAIEMKITGNDRMIDMNEVHLMRWF